MSAGGLTPEQEQRLHWLTYGYPSTSPPGCYPSTSPPQYPAYPPQQPQYPSPPAPPKPLLELNELRDDGVYDDERITGVIERDLVSGDTCQKHGVTGEPLFYPDGRPKLVLLVPLLIVSWPGRAGREGSVRLALCPDMRPDLDMAMQAAGCKPSTVPEAGATVTFTLTPRGDFQLAYAHPDDTSRAHLAKLAVLAAMSPIEKPFWEAHLALALPPLVGLVPQYPIGRYFADFALPDQKISIELDGFETHHSTTDITNDRKRQREIEALGWRVIRFGGQEVHQDAGECVRQAAELTGRLTRLATELAP